MIDAHDDMQWLHGSASAAMGIQSSFESVRQVILNGGASRSSMADSITDSRLKAAARYREITERLCKLSSLQQDILNAAYSPRQWTPELINAFTYESIAGKFVIPVTPFTRAANKFLDEDGGDEQGYFAWLEAMVLRCEDARIQVIRTEAGKALIKAMTSYENS